jgi:hypothetical protein
MQSEWYLGIFEYETFIMTLDAGAANAFGRLTLRELSKILKIALTRE